VHNVTRSKVGRPEVGILPSAGGAFACSGFYRLAVFLAGAASSAHANDVYRYVDAQGGVHYTDTWVPGATLIKVDHRSRRLPQARAYHTDSAGKGPRRRAIAPPLTSPRRLMNAP
jgi:hypothetical protein